MSEGSYEAPAIGGVSIAVIKPALRAAQRAGVNPDQLLAAAGIQRRLLESKQTQISDEENRALWEALPRLTGRAAIGLEAGNEIDPETFGLLGFLVANCASLGEAFEHIARYHALVSQLSRFEFLQGDELVLRIAPSSGRPWPRALADSWVATYSPMATRLTGQVVPALRIDLQHAEPRDAQSYAMLAAPVHFEQAYNAVRYAAEAAELALYNRTEGLASVLGEAAEHALSRLPAEDVLLQRVSALILELLAAGRPRIEQVARRLGMGPRSLQRRLEDRDLTFSHYVDQVASRRAAELLKDPSLTVAEVAEQLGFESSSAFARAFRRWTGRSPRGD